MISISIGNWDLYVCPKYRTNSKEFQGAEKYTFQTANLTKSFSQSSSNITIRDKNINSNFHFVFLNGNEEFYSNNFKNNMTAENSMNFEEYTPTIKLDSVLHDD